jgi:hypothetical protein
MKTKITLGILASGVMAWAVLLASPAAAFRIKCENGFQRVKGDLISSPYCQDEYLAVVAREYGFSATGAKLRNNPNFKKEICRFVFNDIRVQGTCLTAGVPEYYGGGGF